MNEAIDKALIYLGESKLADWGNIRKTTVFTSRSSIGEVTTKTVTSHLTVRAPKVSSRAVGHLAEKLGVEEDVILNVSDISARTFQRRRKDQDTLSEAESDRLLRIARVAGEAERVFGDSAKARRWLSTVNSLLGAKPLDLLATDSGSREVEAELIRIDFGDFS